MTFNIVAIYNGSKFREFALADIYKETCLSYDNFPENMYVGQQIGSFWAKSFGWIIPWSSWSMGEAVWQSTEGF